MSEGIRQRGILIAIDGPSGSGKSTVCRQVARELGIGYLDTGAMYRALTWLCLHNDVDLSDQQAVRAQADSLVLTMASNPDDPHVFINGQDVTAQLRETLVAENVAKIALNLLVRSWMISEQRRQLLAARESGEGMVAEGRDITTVVCPDADVRVLLLADQEARLRRRTLELYGNVSEENLEKTRVQIVDRDASDSTVSEFLTPDEGVQVIDSSHKGIDEVVAEVIAIANNRHMLGIEKSS